MGGNISADSGSLNAVNEAYKEASSHYRNSLQKLQDVVNKVNQGDIKGDLATAFVGKYNEKQDTFNYITNTLNKIDQYMEDQTASFNKMMNAVSESFK